MASTVLRKSFFYNIKWKLNFSLRKCYSSFEHLSCLNLNLNFNGFLLLSCCLFFDYHFWNETELSVSSSPSKFLGKTPFSTFLDIHAFHISEIARCRFQPNKSKSIWCFERQQIFDSFWNKDGRGGGHLMYPLFIKKLCYKNTIK